MEALTSGKGEFWDSASQKIQGNPSIRFQAGNSGRGGDPEVPTGVGGENPPKIQGFSSGKIRIPKSLGKILPQPRSGGFSREGNSGSIQRISGSTGKTSSWSSPGLGPDGILADILGFFPLNSCQSCRNSTFSQKIPAWVGRKGPNPDF